MLNTDTPSEKRRGSSAGQSSAATATEDKPRDEREKLTPAPAPKQRPSEPRLERIAQRAHEIYERRGGAHGKDLDDWLQAEREIDAEME